jgi:histidyl-tRNA synthetase
MARKPKKIFQSVKGMADILPQDQPYWEEMRKAANKVAQMFGFQRIDTPVVEEEDLYGATAGESSDLVEKQMYSFKSKGGDTSLALRPEGTAGVMRAYLEHGMINHTQPVKLFYIGPFFRYEQPQGGRYRQFHQFGFEILGEESPVADAQLVSVFQHIMLNLNIKNTEVQVNSIGCKECRPKFKTALVSFYRQNINKVCKDCRKRIKTNPLRMLDCKDEKCSMLKQQAPQTLDFLCDDCRKHFKNVLEYLDELGVPYVLNPHLVRGLDYYSRTVFEFFVKQPQDAALPEGAEPPVTLAIGGGGRFDNLADMIGNKKVPAVGMAGGMERIAYLMKKSGMTGMEQKPPQVFIAQLGELGRKKSLRLFEELLDKGIRVAEFFGKDSIKSQLRLASKFGVKYTLILGQKEAIDGTIILRDMESSIQEQFPIDKIVEEIKKRMKK